MFVLSQQHTPHQRQYNDHPVTSLMQISRQNGQYTVEFHVAAPHPTNELFHLLHHKLDVFHLVTMHTAIHDHVLFTLLLLFGFLSWHPIFAPNYHLNLKRYVYHLVPKQLHLHDQYARDR